ncbi:MAG: 23S rRNA (adenine(2030)-N(6))-methyltransferase RlmJ [Alphaproteobacteria bacterium]|nr:23S rRNA (adenine(2030)-N(6))-methyltransferase RlmJ [Alphaproteobacteria bacterium]
MNYRHAYHAGNICDVVKHAVLTMLLGHMAQKDTPFAVLDTHAGTGRYNLTDERAQKTGEADGGIRTLIKADPIPELEDYYKIIQKLNGGYIVNIYPGSPLVAAEMLRPQDRLAACELHEEDCSALKTLFRHNKQAHVHARDGYEAMGALLPPPEKRGLVLIDPPYEQPDEFGKVAAMVGKAMTRFPSGIYMIWYPIKDRAAIWRFQEHMAQTAIPKQLIVEYIYGREERGDRLNGSGLHIINPPWKLDEKLAALMPKLHAAMPTGFSETRIKWLTA